MCGGKERTKMYNQAYLKHMGHHLFNTNGGAQTKYDCLPPPDTETRAEPTHTENVGWEMWLQKYTFPIED